MAHAIGTCIFALSIPYTPEQWTLLLPITAMERLLFAAGITVSYVFFTSILDAVDKAWDISKVIDIDKRYVLSVKPAHK
jgi:hypothetical protein